MGNFRDKRGGGDRFGGRGGDRGGFGGGRGGFGGDRPRPEMHQTTCSSCGRSCEVPFRPTGEKPVYCNDCFGKNRDREPRNDRGDRNDAPFKKEYISTPHAPKQSTPDPRIDEIKRQIDQLSSKVDKLIDMMNKAPKAAPVVEAVKAPAVQAVVVEKSAKAKPAAKPAATKPAAKAKATPAAKPAAKAVPAKKPAAKKK